MQFRLGGEKRYRERPKPARDGRPRVGRESALVRGSGPGAIDAMTAVLRASTAWRGAAVSPAVAIVMAAVVPSVVRTGSAPVVAVAATLAVVMAMAVPAVAAPVPVSALAIMRVILEFAVLLRRIVAVVRGNRTAGRRRSTLLLLHLGHPRRQDALSSQTSAK